MAFISKDFLDFQGLSQYDALLKQHIPIVHGYYNNGTFYSDSAKTTTITPEEKKLYVDLSNDKIYEYKSNAYVEVSANTGVTYESKAAAPNGTDVSLVTTGEKYNWNNKVNSSSLGTAAAKDVPTSGNDASSTQVVMGDDSRLTDARTPTTHSHNLNQISNAGSAAAKDYTTSVTQNSGDLVTSGAVWTAIDNLPEPMIFKGSLGTGGTITSLPTASSANIGFTYKVITAGTYASQAAKVGDLFISDGSSWVYIPSADEPSGTVTSVGISNGGGLTVSGSPVTSSGTITVSHADTSSQASVNNSGRTYIQDITLDDYGHVTGITSAAETVTNTDTKVTQTNTTADAEYRILFSENANDTTQTVTARKSTGLKYNPSYGIITVGSSSLEGGLLPAVDNHGALGYSNQGFKSAGIHNIFCLENLYVASSNSINLNSPTIDSNGNLNITTINGVTVGSSPKFTDTNTTYSAGTGLNLSGTEFSVDSTVAMKTDIPSLPLSTANGGTGNSDGYIRTGQKSGTTMGTRATAEGYNNTASGEYSHAEGDSTKATNYQAHSEGSQTTASGAYSHAEGAGTVASGSYSHAEGSGTAASGRFSHAGGFSTTAGYDNQTVIGKFNNNKSTSLFEIGNGTANNASNAFEVDSSGNVTATSFNGALGLNTSDKWFEWTGSGTKSFKYEQADTSVNNLPHKNVVVTVTKTNNGRGRAIATRWDTQDATTWVIAQHNDSDYSVWGSWKQLAFQSSIPTVGTAAAKNYTDSTSASALSTSSNLVTERDVYYGTPKINNKHGYTSNSNYYAPTSAGTATQYLKANGSTLTPTWQTADTSPTSDSSNLITSGGVYTALQNAGGGSGGTKLYKHKIDWNAGFATRTSYTYNFSGFINGTFYNSSTIKGIDISSANYIVLINTSPTAYSSPGDISFDSSICEPYCSALGGTGFADYTTRLLSFSVSSGKVTVVYGINKNPLIDGQVGSYGYNASIIGSYCIKMPVSDFRMSDTVTAV